jgi:hypothetical protein
MSRRVWTNSCASVIASLGLASGQTPPAAATDGTPGGVVTLRTSGQPDRKLQILKSERMPDGKILNEVKDLASGQVFTIVDTKPFAGTQTTPANQLPQAKPRTSDPLMPGTIVPASAATTARPVARYENGPAPQTTHTEYPTLVGKLRGNATPAPSTPATPGKQSAISAALLGKYPTEPAAQPTPTLMNRLGENRPTAPATTSQSTVPTTTTPAPSGGIKSALFGTPGEAPVENPTLMGKLFGDKPAAAVPSNAVVQSPPPVRSNMIRPNAIASGNAKFMTPPATVGAAPVNTAPILEPRMTPVSVAPPAMPVAVQPASYTPQSTDSRDPNFHVKPAEPMTMKQIEDQVKELRMNQRPSKRMDAATALANGPMANMVEVRQILAEATYRDPVGVVRAHCIELLSKMKYDEFNYKAYVETLVNDDEPAVQRAARAAMK